MKTPDLRKSNNQLHNWQIVDRWRQLPQDALDRLPKGLSADMSERVLQSAESRVAESRIEDMTPIVSRRLSPSIKAATKIVVVIFGAFTFSTGMQVLTSRLGTTAVPAAMVGGAVASYLVEDRATKAIAKMRVAHGTRQELKAIEHQQQSHPPGNELGKQFYLAQMNLVKQLEGKHLEKQLSIDAILAGAVSAGEFATALWIVVQLGLPGGILIEAIAASLPVALIWIASAFQSDRFELPEHYVDLIQKYQSYLFPPEDMPEVESVELLEKKEAQEVRIDWLVKYVAEGDSSQRLKNLGMAEADFDANEARQRKRQLEQERDRSIQHRLFQHRAEVAELPDRFPVTDVDTVGAAPEEIKQRQQRVERQRQQWVQQKTAEMETILADDLKMSAHIYSTKIQQCEEDIVQAQKRYQEAYRHWKEDNDDSGGDLNDAA